MQVHVVLFAFDLLYLNETPLLRTSFRERRQLLHSNFPIEEGCFYHASYLDCTKVEQIQEYLERSITGVRYWNLLIFRRMRGVDGKDAR